jgi:hypothetical protein
MASSPFERVFIVASQIHYLISDDESVRKKAIMQCLKRYHGVPHISKMDVDEVRYKEWRKQNPELMEKILANELKSVELIREDSTNHPQAIEQFCNMELGTKEEIETLSLLEKELNAKKLSFAVVSDQKGREISITDKITIIGRFDALIEKIDKEKDKRVTSGVIEVKTRMHSYRDDLPEDMTQLCVYSRMVSNPSKLIYILVQRVVGTKEIKKKIYTYTELDEHWNKIIVPKLSEIYPLICNEWKRRTDETSLNYIGIDYGIALKALINRLLVILKIPEINGSVLLITTLETLIGAIEQNYAVSYKAFCSRLTPQAKLHVDKRDIEFFRQNVQILANTQGDYKETLDKYTEYLANILQQNVSEKTLSSVWALVDKVVALV